MARMAIALLLLAQPALAEWKVVPDGPTTYAVEWNDGQALDAEWAHAPGLYGMRPPPARACNRVPSDTLADLIARALNGAKKP